ncbi:cysteine--tRNA ligase [Elusimicrobiota bacterium]
MMEIYLTNTFSNDLELFKPYNPKKVGFYVCGITPYDHVHLGHARSYVVFDITRRTLEAAGYKVIHVQNFTDVDDKIINRSKELNVSAFYLTSGYIKEYFTLMGKLNVTRAHKYPRVSKHIKEIIIGVKKLIDNDHAYVASNGDVYYSVRNFPGYGRLSRRNTEELLSGARVEVSDLKKDPLDFALWKSTPQETELENGKPKQLAWKSPWGVGRPGWHIECSIMSTKHIGPHLDIHGGGQDLIFPHHENEIAQSEALNGPPFTKYFLHNGFVNINDEKMSKSLGNFFKLVEVLDQFDAMDVRYYLLSEHYRRPLDFSDTGIIENSKAFARIKEALGLLFFVNGNKAATQKSGIISNEVLEHLCRDFHTPLAIAYLQGVSSKVFSDFKSKKLEPKTAKEALADMLWALDKLLGLKVKLAKPSLPAQASKLIKEREQSRQKKDFKRADEIRSILTGEHSVHIEDTPYGTLARKK